MSPQWWNQDTGVWVKMALAGATLAVVIWELRARTGDRSPADTGGPAR